MDISSDAEPIEIKKAFKKLARKYHPDLVANSDDPNVKAKAERTMKQLNIAKEILLDPEKRSKYDLKVRSSQIDDSEVSFVVSESDEEIEELEIDWEFNEYFDNDESLEDWDTSDEYDNSTVIPSPPASSYSQPTYDPANANTLGFEISPGVLFLQKCIKCGRVNFQGTPVCLGCGSSLIFDKQRYISPGQGEESIFGPPTRPGFKPSKRPEMIIIKKCLKCGAANNNNSPVCPNCNSSMVYYQRSIPRMNLDANGFLDHRHSSLDQGIFECPKCGAENDPERKFCYSCYSNLQNIRREIILDSSLENSYQYSKPDSRNDGYKRCPNCGEFNSKSRDFCLQCNTRLVYNQPPMEIEVDNSDLNFEQIDKQIKNGKVECPHCGIENPIDKEICISCFKNILPRDKIHQMKKDIIDWAPTAAEVRREYYYSRICPRCGFENGSESKFCMKCGLEI